MKFAYLIEPPFNDVDASGTVIGCDVELARHVCRQLGAEPFDPIQAEFSELLPGLAAQNWRMTTGLFATDDRQKQALFTRPIWALPDGLLVASGNPLGIFGYGSIAQNPNAKLAVIRDQFQHRSAVEFSIPSDRIEIFEVYADAATAVATGKADAYASVARAHDGFVGLNPALKLETVIVPEVEKPPAFGSFAVGLSDQMLLADINLILDAYIGSAPHRDMMGRYGFTPTEVDRLLV